MPESRQSINCVFYLCLLLMNCLVSVRFSCAADKTDFVRRKNDQLVVGKNEQVVYLRGVNTCACVVDTGEGTDWLYGTCQELTERQGAVPVTNWYQEKHFQYLADIGFNTVRVMLHYRIFEDDSFPGSYRESGWEFLDTYIRWAKNHNLYLILDMHTPQGGLQPSGGGGACLWDDTHNQSRITNLWRAIAQHYADEPTIAAFDLLNEPTPTSSVSQWQSLAQQLVDTIRTVDQNHVIIVERVNWIFGAGGLSPLEDYTMDVLSSFQVPVDDENVIYDYHFYDPAVYCLQNEGSNSNDGTYPDLTEIETAKDGTAFPRTKDYLEYEMDLETRDGPVFVGEWGPNSSTFNSEKGGYRYIEDVLGLFDQYNVHWTYFSMWNLYEVECCEAGVVCCGGDNPTVPNTELIHIFSSYFKNQPTKTTSSIDSSTSTTAPSQPCFVREVYGEDSEETSLLRQFRDHVLKQTPEGRELIKLYYRVSPLLIAIKEGEGFTEEVREAVSRFVQLFRE